MVSETSETTLHSGGRGRKGERQNRSEKETTPSLSPFLSPNPFRRLPRRLQKCRLEVIEDSMTCHELGFLYLFVCLLGESWWGEVGKQPKQLPEKLNR